MGISCDRITPPSGHCSANSAINELTFRVTDDTCSESRNSQGPDFVCAESGNALPTSGPVNIVCIDASSGQTFLQQSVNIGGVFYLQDKTLTQLPEVTTCAISDQNSNQLQTLTINTGGHVDVFLKDTYGTLKLEGCNINGMAQQCIVPLNYTYVINNTGAVEMIINVVDRTRNGTTVSLLNLVPNKDLLPGQSTTVTETENVDICVEGLYKTTLYVSASPPKGFPCHANATYVFPIHVNCRVSVDISCVDSAGVQCNQLQPPQGVCSVGSTEMTALTLKYVGSSCQSSHNKQPASTCQDVNGGLTPGASTTILCVDAATGTSVMSPVTVSPDQTFVVENSSGLPSQLTCTLSQGGTTKQVVTFDSSGQSPLNLNDQFGGLDVQSCTNSADVTQTCLDELTYSMNIHNIGTNIMDVSVVNVTQNGVTTDYLSQVPNTHLSPGQSTQVTVTQTVDLCVPGAYTTSTLVQATPPGPGICQAQGNYTFVISPPPTPPPTPAPVPPPTPAPVPPPTPAPVPPPTPAPVPPLTPAPVPPPTPAPVPPPTPALVPPPTPPPVPTPIPAPVSAQTPSPILLATAAPISPSIQAPVPPPTAAPASSSTSVPVLPTTVAPVLLPIPLAPSSVSPSHHVPPSPTSPTSPSVPSSLPPATQEPVPTLTGTCGVKVR